MRFLVLGPLEVEADDGRTHVIGSANQRAILAMLLANPGAIVTTDELVDAIWGTTPPPSAIPTLRTYVSRLRRLVGDRIVGHDDGYSIVCREDHLDARSFEQDVVDGRFDEAMARWRGCPYGDAADLPRVRADVARLEALAATARAGRVGELLRARRIPEAIGAAEAVVLDDPVNEAAWCGLVRALAAAGRTADALRAYQRAVAALADAGLSPGSDLRDAEHEALLEPAPTSASRRVVPAVPLTESVGLESDVDRVLGLTAQRRLVTIVGPGGVGKTRLGLEVGHRAADRHALGTRVVDLTRTNDRDAIVPSIRRALDLAEQDTTGEEGIGAVDALLVLDNCEHMIDDVAALVPRLLPGGDRLRILATSREPLRVNGEQRWALPPLRTQGHGAPAVALLVERARDVGADVDPDDPAARSIVTRLDGLPLAIEMAAARLTTATLEEVAEDLARNLTELRTGHRDAAERHSTLQAVLAWSEALLDDGQRTTLAEFSVFAGPVPDDDLAAAVSADDPAAAVRELVDRSLLTTERHDGSTRFGSFHTVRRIGRTRLREEGRFDTVAGRHARWYVDVAEQARQTFDGADQIHAIRRIDASLDEFRAAHRWSRSHDPALAHRLSRALFQPALQGLRLEILEWSRALADATAPNEPGAAEVYGEVSAHLVLLGRVAEAEDWAHRAIAAASSPAECRVAFTTLSDAALYTGELARALEYGRRHQEAAEAAESPTELAYGIGSIALPLAYLGRHDEALAEIPPAPADASPTVRGWLAYAHGEVLLDSEPEEALDRLDLAVDLADSVDSWFLRGVAQVSAASLRAREGRPDDAAEPLRAAIEHFATRGDAVHLLTTLRNTPALLIRLGEWRAAAELLGGLSAITISPTYGEEAARLQAAEHETREALGEDEYARTHDAGAGRDLDVVARDTIDHLRAWATIGRAVR